MNDKEIKEFVNEFLEKAESCCLVTIDDQGNPSNRGVFNLRNTKKFPSLKRIFDNHREDLRIYISTNTSSNKFKHISSNPNISICFLDPKIGKGITLEGKAKIITDMEVKKDLWLDWWSRYYPMGVEDPDFAIIQLDPKRGKIWFKGKLNFNLE